MLRFASCSARRVCGAVLTALLLASCGGDDATGPNGGDSYTGSYVLKSIDGHAVPTTTYEDEFQRDEVRSGALVVRANGTFTMSFAEFRTRASTGLTEDHSSDVSGSYDVDNSDASVDITFTESGDSPEIWEATFSGRRITMLDDSGEVYVFEK